MTAEATPAVRADVYLRDAHLCASCGRGVALTLQHRRRRGMGGVQGDAAAAARDYPNLLTLCNGCNVALEQDAHFAKSGQRFGWRLLDGEDPGRVAVWFVWAREWRLLLPDGTAVPVFDREPANAAALIESVAA